MSSLWTPCRTIRLFKTSKWWLSVRLQQRAAEVTRDRYKDMYRERVERQYKTVNPNATQQVLRRPIAQKCHVARAQLHPPDAAACSKSAKCWRATAAPSLPLCPSARSQVQTVIVMFA